jgi:hypothetical protein
MQTNLCGKTICIGAILEWPCTGTREQKLRRARLLDVPSDSDVSFAALT